jgi:hypothetical protein
VESRVESADGAEIDGKKIEEQRSLGFRCQRDELSSRVRFYLAVDVLEICRLTAQARAVIDNLQFISRAA